MTDRRSMKGGGVLDRLGRFSACRGGVAAVEFALVAPILIALFFGVVETVDALARSRQVTLAANTLADLAAQEARLETTALDDLFSGVEQIMGEGGDAAEIRLISVSLDADGDPVVNWSRNNEGDAPYAKGADYDLSASTLIDPGSSILVGEIDYAYTSKLTGVFVSSILFERAAVRWPRRSMRVQLCAPSGTCLS